MSEKVLLLLLALVFIAIENSLGQHHGDPKINPFIFPGTKWCGKGSIAKSYNDLGKYKKTDRCCRTHDKHCKARIEPYKRKYGLLNWSWKVASHCECEVRFKKCLKKVDDHASSLVYFTYFKVIKPRCIRLKHVKTCVKRSWKKLWKCAKKKCVTRAYFVSLKKAVD